jgi:hypothetical protein
MRIRGGNTRAPFLKTADTASTGACSGPWAAAGSASGAEAGAGGGDVCEVEGLDLAGAPPDLADACSWSAPSPGGSCRPTQTVMLPCWPSFPPTASAAACIWGGSGPNEAMLSSATVAPSNISCADTYLGGVGIGGTEEGDGWEPAQGAARSAAAAHRHPPTIA